ncbi:hypothetical protein NLJ89_g3714 [Agrocybe chaxingu]|uniref:F-box domain-containing protein n=1 Tax=Agrocybe chaxingu TaxID=84603 RepID=A0A9W8MWM1_9AGAR|nr:hypothetical protein NLJ89_g3714 [Agrocybe chaxingu]
MAVISPTTINDLPIEIIEPPISDQDCNDEDEENDDEASVQEGSEDGDYERDVDADIEGSDAGSEDEDSIGEDLRDPASFPISVACVCLRWWSILKGFPKFWTRIAIDIGHQSFTRMLDTLSFSGTLPLCLLVFHRQETTLDADTEKRRMEAVMERLAQRPKRCFYLNFDIRFSKSLPHLSTVMALISPKVNTVKLISREDNCRNDVSPHPPVASPSNGFPNLKTLSLTVTMFMSMYRLSPEWWKALDGEEFLHLTISSYSFGADGTDIDVFDFLSAIVVTGGIAELELSHLSLASPQEADKDKYSGKDRDLDVSSLSLTKLSGYLVSTLFDFLSITTDSTTITSCNLKGTFKRFLFLFNLILVDMPVTTDIRPLLFHWGGRCLSVRNCSSFDDGLLEFLSKDVVWGHNSQDGGSKPEFAAFDATEFNIRDCENFTFRALKGMVKGRNKAAPSLNFLRRVEEVTVCGRAPTITAEEVQWFESNLRVALFPVAI